MGTWSASPFGSDSALDLLDQFSDVEEGQRAEFLEQIFRAGLSGPADGAIGKVLPDEVIAAAAILAASLPGGQEFPWNQDVDDILLPSVSRSGFELPVLALRALRHVIPDGGWWWRSWKDERDAEQMRAALNQIEGVLLTA